MQKACLLLLAVIACGVLRAQQNSSVVINPVKQNEQELYKKIFQYPEFTAGRAYIKGGGVSDARFNYNYFTNQIMFIAPKGDTLELINGGNFSQIVIGTDTFFYCDKQFVQQLTHFSVYNLLLKHSLQNRGSEKKGAYDTYSGNSSITPVNLIVDSRLGTVKLATDENITFVFKDYYYVSGKYGQFYPASKKGFSNLFGNNEKELKDFLEKNDINFNKKEDLEKLLEYARTLIK